MSIPNSLTAFPGGQSSNIQSQSSSGAAEGITDPPIDDLLYNVSSKYALAIFAAKRARQIQDYYAQLGEGLLEYVGPLVEPGPREKPLSIALREIHAGVLQHSEGA
ncbi:DNA-directed RNA polymerase subunit omega [Actinopolyspora mzabensis]|uniref:DNA-directed RNA polymerase subunit omega n=1 Tax=Actinopolyspora mzabensis TaxID=995066 RepID=A0A1G9B9J5_ACTMZ|nr:DNA-directed RNA polymerase subunit omega [Actinopolyspora mzabensis]SDK35774.1 DNA-directed RNA polymerase subunit omega [Actinopolyspora mzabensis]